VCVQESEFVWGDMLYHRPMSLDIPVEHFSASASLKVSLSMERNFGSKMSSDGIIKVRFSIVFQHVSSVVKIFIIRCNAELGEPVKHLLNIALSKIAHIGRG
jgi:hypothetical protein